MGLKRAGLLSWLVVLAAAAGSQVMFANAAPTLDAGKLVLSGGIQATIKLDSANCMTGPGDSFSVNAANRGGWDSLFFSASDPRPGRRGTAQVSLEGAQYTGDDAVEDWGWIATRNSGHVSLPWLSFTSNAEAGAIKTVLPVISNYLGPRTASVDVRVSWSVGTCKAIT